MRVTLRMPKAMVTASNVRSANGSASALASVKVDPRRRATALPSRALAPDREHVGVDVADHGASVVAAGRDRPQGNVAGAAGDIEQRERPASSAD